MSIYDDTHLDFDIADGAIFTIQGDTVEAYIDDLNAGTTDTPNADLHVIAGGTLNVESGATFSLDNTAIINGTSNINGTLSLNSDITVGSTGVLIIDGGTVTTSGGNILIEEGGSVVIRNNGQLNMQTASNSFQVDGTLSFESGGTMNAIEDIEIGATGRLSLGGSTNLTVEDVTSDTGGVIDIAAYATLSATTTFLNNQVSLMGETNIAGTHNVPQNLDKGTVNLTGSGELNVGNELRLLFDGSLVIESNSTINAFSLSATNNLADVSIDVGGDAVFDVVFIQSVATISVEGEIQVSGDFKVTNENSTIDGTGELVVYGTATIDENVEVHSFTDCGDGDTCGGGDALPVTWQTFYATLENRKVSLLWSTAKELNNLGFEMQASLDGIEFDSIAFVPGNGTTEQQQDYHFTVNRIMPHQYYRLRQIDIDGAEDFSKTIYMEIEFPKAIVVFPNPVKDELHFSGDPNLPMTVMIISVEGKLLLNETGSLL